MKTKKNKKSGFTLVELMIVAAIIAILAAIVIPLLASNRDRAVAADGQNLLGTTATAIKSAIAEGKTLATGALTSTGVGALTLNELGKSKYFNVPTITALSVGSGAVTYTLQATTKAGAGTFATATTLTLDDLGAWGGGVATALGL